MSNLHERIAQWEKMTREVPDDMSWFSLGGAYLEAGRLEDADKALAKSIELNPGMSRAYQLRAQALIKLGHETEAAAVLTSGYMRAAERGDVMPQRAMESLLQKLGQPVPKIASAAAVPAIDPNDPNAILDKRTGRPGTRMPDAPMRGPLGKFILDHYSQETWREWIRQGTKVINELRLDFSRPDHQKVYEQHMMEWLGMTMEEVERAAK
jgi:Fe-S cluster biosynthesis and repair protein YggX